MRTIAKPPLTLRAAQVLMILPLGALVAVAGVVFSITETGMTAVDYVVGAAACALGAANAYLGSRLGSGAPELRRAAVAVLLGQLGFGLVKLIGYGESASVTFMTLDVAALMLLNAESVRRFVPFGVSGSRA